MRTGIARHPDWGQKACVQWEPGYASIHAFPNDGRPPLSGPQVAFSKDGWSFEWDSEPEPARCPNCAPTPNVGRRMEDERDVRTGTARHPEFGDRQCVEWDDGVVAIRGDLRDNYGWSYEGVARATQNGWNIEWDPEPGCDRPHAEDVEGALRDAMKATGSRTLSVSYGALARDDEHWVVWRPGHKRGGGDTLLDAALGLANANSPKAKVGDRVRWEHGETLVVGKVCAVWKSQDIVSVFVPGAQTNIHLPLDEVTVVEAAGG